MFNGDDGHTPPPPPSDPHGGFSDLFSSSDLPDAGATGMPQGASHPPAPPTESPKELPAEEHSVPDFGLPSIDFSLPPGVDHVDASPAPGAELPAHLQLPSFPDFELPPVPGEPAQPARLVGDVGIERNLGGSFDAMNDTAQAPSARAAPPPAPAVSPVAPGLGDDWAVTPPGQMPPPPPKRTAKTQQPALEPGFSGLPSLPQISLPSVAGQPARKEPTLLRAEKAEEIAKIKKKSVVGPIVAVALLVAGAGVATFMYRDAIISSIFPEKKTTAEETTTDKARKMVAVGQAAFDANNYAAAIDAFDKALKIDPTYAKAHRSLAIAYASAKQPEKAVEHYRMYLVMDPAAPDAADVKKIVADYDSKAKERADEAQKKAEEDAKAQAEAAKAQAEADRAAAKAKHRGGRQF